MMLTHKLCIYMMQKNEPSVMFMTEASIRQAVCIIPAHDWVPGLALDEDANDIQNATDHYF